MLNFACVRSALVAALLIIFTLSIGARPEALTGTITRDAPPIGITAADVAESDSEVLSGRAEADSRTGTSTFYSLRPDLRRCASPLCGGYFVRRVNQRLTRCADGRSRTECYVSEIDWNGQSQVDAPRALLRGNLTAKAHPRFGKLGMLEVRESWQAASDAGADPADGFYKVKDRGVRCITHPCPTHHEAKLNTTIQRNIAGVDLTAANAPDDLVAQATAAMTGDGLHVVGSHVRVSGPAGKSVSLKAIRFYLRASVEQSNKPCIKTGCSSQICADEPVATTCEWRREYECYQKARCERQANGRCGFTQTAELKSCLARN